MEKDIENALRVWRNLNVNPNLWARLEADEFRVVVSWGHRWNGRKDREIETIRFNPDGTETRYTHS